MLLDGGFLVNCPAPVACFEAAAIWPKKRCDILVSLGTGVSVSGGKSLPNIIQVLKKMVELATDSEDIWSKFKDHLDREAQLRVFRLNPQYSGIGFALDDFEKLDEIEKQTTAWLATQKSEIDLICNRLIAALFFFVQTSRPDSNKLTGDILCRLPVDLGARQRLFEGMGKEPKAALFVVELIDHNRPPVEIRAGWLEHTRSGEELRVPFELRELPVEGQITLQISMRNFRKKSDSRLFPISGSPYVVR
jgi:hypothetical protein